MIYDGPRSLAGFRIPVAWKPKQLQPSAAQNTASNLETTDAATRDNLLGGVQGSTQAAQNTLAGAQPTLNRITQVQPNTGTTQLRQALTNSLTSGTNQAYNNAEVAQRARAAGMGLADQPMTAGNEAATENQRAAALGQIPGQVEQQATQEELAATGLENQQAGIQNQLAQTGLGEMAQYNPNAPLQTEAGLQQALYGAQAQQNQATGGLWGGLAKAGLGLISPIKL